MVDMISWASSIRSHTFEMELTEVKLHTQTNLKQIHFQKWSEEKMIWKTGRMSVCKKMIENVPDDLNVYSILFYSI